MATTSLDGKLALVTGGAGFIGSHLVDALLERGARVRVLDDFSTGSEANLEHLTGVPAFDVRRGDLRDMAACTEACRGVDVVFHQGALGSVPRSMEDPATSMAVNVGGTANLFTAARDAGVRRIVFASSSSVYGDSATLPKREGEEGEPLSPYAMSKRMCEDLAAVFSRCFELEIVGLRYFNVYGPRQSPDGPYAAVIPRFFDAYARGEAPTIHGDGAQSRDFTFVLDAVRANLLAAESAPAACGRAYNVAGGRRTDLNTLAAAVRRAAGGGPDPHHGPPRPGDVRHSLADLTDATRALGYRPMIDLDEGLARAAGHYLVAATAGS